jgi:transcriptional regulator with XRE-family HTH domain
MITRMKAERVRRGWTQAVLASKAGMMAPDISRIESGRTKPYPIQVARLSKALRIDIPQLLELVPDPRPGYENL